MHKITKILSAISLSLIYSIGAVSALGGVRDSKAVEAADTSSDTTRVFCIFPSDNNNICAYSWKVSGSSEKKNAVWPGKAMSLAGYVSSSLKVMYCDIPTDCFENVIFSTTGQSSSSESTRYQTSNLTLSSSKLLYKFIWDSPTSTSDGNRYKTENYDLSSSNWENFRLLGYSFGWSVSDKTPKLERNTAASGYEYYVQGVDLEQGSGSSVGYKAVFTDEDGTVIEWNAIGNSNFDISTDGRYDVYFNPQGNSAWTTNNYINFILNNEYKLALKRDGETVGSEYTLVKNPSPATATDVEYMVGKYDKDESKYVVTPIDVKKGDTLTLKNDVEISSFTATAVGSNNYGSDGKFIYDASCEIYVNVTTSKIYAGLDADFGMIVGDKFVPLTKNAENTDTTVSEYYVYGYDFKANDVIKFANATGETLTVFTNNVLDDHGYNSCFEVLSDNGGIKVKADVTVSLYLKLGTPNNTVYFTSSAYDQAIEYANAFETKFGFSSTTDTGVCKHDGTTSTDEISATWTEMKTKYTVDVTDETAQKILNGEISSSHDSIVKFHNAYDYIYSKYGTSLSLDNFLNRTSTTSSARSLNLTSDNSVTFIAIIVVASITLIAASSYIVVKKSKRQ